MKHSVVVVVLGLSLAAGCSGGTDGGAPAPSGTSAAPSPTPSPTPTPDPQTLEAAAKVGQEYADRYTSLDYAGAWLLSAPRTRDGISQDDFVKLAEECDAEAVLPIKVTGVRLDGTEKAVVRLSIEGLGAVTREMEYVDGRWYQSPSKSMAPLLGKPLAEIVKAQKASGDC